MSDGLKAVGGCFQFTAVLQFLGYSAYYLFGGAVNILDLVFIIGFVVVGAAISRAGKHLEKPVAVKKDELEPFPPGWHASP